MPANHKAKEKDPTDYEPVLIVTVFGVFFTLMFSRLNAEFLPSHVYYPPWGQIVSIIPVAAFVFFSFCIIFDYLNSQYRGILKATWTRNCGFSHFVVHSGLRTLAIAGTPLAVFYIIVWPLYLILPQAFPPENKYDYAALIYFSAWFLAYFLERHYGRDS
ncbi:MAG: hypothetical protein WED04_09620 [Promethearchaeati archaeon SRVP18_Atabeyarchaeia-1]